jgi:multisubunit Na+/H+ antiporter MnhF subunit
LIIRWPAEEKRLRTAIFIPLFAVVAGIALSLLRVSVSPEVQREAITVGTLLAFVAFAYGCYTIWFSRLWVLDKQQNALLRGGWRRVADLDEFDRFIVKREKRGRDIVFLMLAERKDGTFENLGIMDQQDADDLGYEIARFTRRPYSSR